jgi:hypothetical protein
MTPLTTNQGNRLTHLFDLELKYTGQFPDAEAATGRVGDYIGSGQGTVRGPHIQGHVPRWDLYEEVNEAFCRSNLSGVIETEDGARIHSDTMGFFMVPDKAQPHLWTTSAAVHFETKDERYVWLNAVLGVWEGTFDMESYRHQYRVYARQA